MVFNKKYTNYNLYMFGLQCTCMYTYFLLEEQALMDQERLLVDNEICIPESFNTNISHQIFDYAITFLNSQNQNENSKDDFVLKNWF